MNAAKEAMKAFLKLDPRERAEFDRMRDDLDYMMRHADALPKRHPESASRRWKALEHFKKHYDL